MEILPRFDFLSSLGSDNGLTFMDKVSQQAAKMLGIHWKLCCAYRSQSSGQVERANGTIKEILTKFWAETGKEWIELLIILFWNRCAPYQDKLHH